MCGGGVTTSRRIRTGIPSRRAERGLFNPIWCSEPSSRRMSRASLSGTAHHRQLLDHAVKPAEARPVDGNVKHNKRRILVSNIAQKSIEPRSKYLSEERPDPVGGNF